LAGIDTAAEVAADREVQQQEVGLVEHPGSGHVGRGDLVVLHPVDVPGDEVRLPVDREGVVTVVAEVVRAGERGFVHRHPEVVDVTDAAAAAVAGAVDGAEDLLGQPAHVLHDVDLTGARPRVVGDVGPEAPERGPQAGTAVGHLEPRLDAAVGELLLVLRQEPRGGELARAVVALLRPVGFVEGDDEVAVTVVGRVGRVVGVELQLVVAPAVLAVRRHVADLVRPALLVRDGPRGRVELVAPDEVPALRSRVVRAVVLERDDDLLAGAGAVVPERHGLGTGPVLRQGEVPHERGLLGDVRERLSVEGQPFNGRTSPQGTPISLARKWKMRSCASVTVHVRDLPPRLTRAPVDVRLGGVAEGDRRVVDRRGVEGRGRQQVDRDDPVASVARVALDVDRDGLRHGGDRQVLDRVLTRTRPVVALGHPDALDGARTLDVPQVRTPGELVDLVGVERVGVDDDDRALEQRPALRADRVGEPDDDQLVALEPRVVEGLDLEGQLARATLLERQGAAGGRELLAGNGVGPLGRVVDRHGVRVVGTERAVQPHRHLRRPTLLHEGVLLCEVDRDGWDPRLAVDAHLVDVERPRASRAERADRPPVDLEPVEAIVRGAVADLLA
jgi:hypothetical protein